MDSIHLWIDKEEVGRLAESLTSSPERMKEWKALETDGFAIPEKQGQAEIEVRESARGEAEQVSDISAEALSQQREMLAGASQMAKSSGLIPTEDYPADATTMAIPAIPCYETELAEPAEIKMSSNADSGMFDSVKRLFSEQVGAKGVCAIEADGDVLLDDLGSAGLTRFVANVMKNSSLVSVAEDEVDGMRLKVLGSELIEFISVKSTRGVVLVAARVQQSLSLAERRDVGMKLLEVLNA